MKLHDLHPNAGATKSRKRVGRGIGSGHGKTSCRGAKGQHSRNTVRPGFEGGQTPLHRRLPRFRGFSNVRFQIPQAILNVSDLERLFEAGTVITPEFLLEKRLIKGFVVHRKKDGTIHRVEGKLKILGDGDITKALTVKAHKFSKSAMEKLAAAGGSAEVIA